MIDLNIPGRGKIQLEHLESDENGALAVDGQLQAADLIAPDIFTALNLLEITLCIVASLRQ